MRELSVAENLQRAGRGGRTRATLVFEFCSRELFDLPPDPEDMCVEDAVHDWLLGALRIAACMNQSLRVLASSYPARISCVNFSWQDVCQQISGLGLVRLVGGQEVILSPLGHFFHQLVFALSSLNVLACGHDVADR